MVFLRLEWEVKRHESHSILVAILEYCYFQLSVCSPRYRWLWGISFLILWFIMGFRRDVGVDFNGYREVYERVLQTGFFGYYRSGNFLEPGYLLAVLLIGRVFGDFAVVFACSSFFALALFYKNFAYEIQEISLGLCIFIFSSTQYFYYFGIERLFIAVSIVAFAFRYLILGRKKKFFCMWSLLRFSICLRFLCFACFCSLRVDLGMQLLTKTKARH